MNTLELLIIMVSLLISLPLMFLAFIVIRQSFQANREIKHIRKNGAPAEAIISSIRQTNSEINGHPEVYIGLTIPRNEAEPYRTMIKTVIAMVNIPQYQPGRKVNVMVLEEGGKLKVAIDGAPVF
jgi:hypothetical protein